MRSCVDQEPRRHSRVRLGGCDGPRVPRPPSPLELIRLISPVAAIRGTSFVLTFRRVPCPAILHRTWSPLSAASLFDRPAAEEGDTGEVYARYAEVYDAFFGDIHNDAQFYRRKARREVLGPGGSVLEIGSGTGRVAERFLREGYRVTGVDASPATPSRRRRGVGGAPVEALGGAPTAGGGAAAPSGRLQSQPLPSFSSAHR